MISSTISEKFWTRDLSKPPEHFNVLLMPPTPVWHDHCIRCHYGTIGITKPSLTINISITHFTWNMDFNHNLIGWYCFKCQCNPAITDYRI